jgi:hypothetical protein
MSLEGTKYDKNAFKYSTRESTGPLKYVMDIYRQESCTPCGGDQNVAKHSDRVALENDILGHNRILTHDESMKYQKNDKIANTLPFISPYICERNLANKSFIDNNTDRNNYMQQLKNKKQ